ncbi:MAG TPA: hypothetical protein VEU47_09095 [Candidatus Cybelea sp.]|nr:hypothetical protein [Candidatus Cybelea sp.]
MTSTVAAESRLTAHAQVTLKSGAIVELWSIRPFRSRQGWTALMLQYQTKTPFSDRVALRREADEIWERFVIDAIRSGQRVAIISANEFRPASNASSVRTPSFDFIYRLDQGSWRAQESIVNPPQRIEAETVKEFVARTDWLAANHDANALLLYLADDWTAGVKVQSDRGVEETVLDRSQVAAQLRVSEQRMKNHEHKREIVKIDIAADGQSATVESLERDTFEVGGERFASKAHEIDEIRLVNGSLVFTRSASDGNVQREQAL